MGFNIILFSWDARAHITIIISAGDRPSSVYSFNFFSLFQDMSTGTEDYLL